MNNFGSQHSSNTSVRSDSSTATRDPPSPHNINIASLQSQINDLLDQITVETVSLDSSSIQSEPEPTPIRPPFSSIAPPLHNPRHLGTVPYYFPPRFSNRQEPSLQPGIQSPIPSTAEADEALPTTRRFHQSTLDNGCWDDFQTSCETLQHNDPWGDNFLVKNDHTFRIYFQNLNSCGLSQGPDKWGDILNSMITSECDIMNFAQTSVNWKLLRMRNAMHDPIRSRMPIYKLHVARNKFESDQATLPGGVAQIVKGDWTSRVLEYIQDPRLMGRWCGIKLRLKNDRNLYIFSAYRVCDQSISTIGAETAFGQQDYMLTMEGFEYPNPRRQFIEDMVDVIKELQNGLDEFLILMDANEQLGTNAHGLTYLMRECHLIDIFHQHHGVCPEFSTYDSGNSRLDYAIGSSTLLPFINQCGFLPFYQGVSSDHRGMFIDISMEIIDGLTHLEHIPRRHLNSAFQVDVYRYKQEVNKSFISNDIFNKAESIFHRSGSNQQHNSEYHTEIEALDKLIVKLQLKAERTCFTPRTKYDWSDEIHFHKVIVKYWAIQRKTKTKRRNVKAVTKQIYDTLPDTYRQYVDIAAGSPLRKWERAKRKLKSLKAQHRKQIEQIHVDSIANEATFLGTTAEQVRLKRERNIRDKKLYTTLRQHFHPCTRSGISHLLVPDCDTNGIPTDDADAAATWKSETSPEIILERLLDRNIKHFGQAQGSPFTVPPLSSTFGFDGMSHDGQQLCQEGTIPPIMANIHSVTQDVLQRLGDETYRHPISHDLISFDDFQSAIKKWRESTSTSPSGRHLGHYKCLLAIDSHSSEYNDENPDPGQQLLKVLYHVAASAFQSGFTLSRWTKITTCMIEKIPGTPRLNKLRIIHLYEADYNLINKLVWQRGVVWQAHQRGTLNPAQSGSRPYKTCIEVVLSKEFKYLYSQLTRTSMGTMDNDAKSCYDRIVAAIALLISNQFGVPTEICQTVGATLQQMQFHLRTGMGDSHEFYSHTADTPVHGVGQGGTASPAFWLLVSSALFDCHRSKASGMNMTDPTQTISLRQWLEAIVDDTSVFTNAGREPLIDDLVRTLEKDAQYWENLLSVSGGCLELSKCFYYVLAWTFSSQGDPRPLTTTEIAAHTAPVHIQELGKDSSTPILFKAPDVAHKTLGVYKSMTGDETKHIQTLKQRSANMALIVATSGLKPYQAEVAVRMIYTTGCYGI